MKILVNNEVKELTLIDTQSGCEWTQDLIGNAEGFDDYNNTREMYTMTPETYKWWSNYIDRQEAIDRKKTAIYNAFETDQATLDKFRRDMEETFAIDMLDEQDFVTEIIDEWAERIK